MPGFLVDVPHEKPTPKEARRLAASMLHENIGVQSLNADWREHAIEKIGAAFENVPKHMLTYLSQKDRAGRPALQFAITGGQALSKYLPEMQALDAEMESKGKVVSGTHVGTEMGSLIYLKGLDPSNILHEMGHAIDHRLGLEKAAPGKKGKSAMHSQCSCCSISKKKLKAEGGMIRKYAEQPLEAVADGFVLWTDTPPSHSHNPEALRKPREFAEQNTPKLMKYWSEISREIAQQVKRRSDVQKQFFIEAGFIKRGKNEVRSRWAGMRDASVPAHTQPREKVGDFFKKTMSMGIPGSDRSFHSYTQAGKEVFRDYGERIGVFHGSNDNQDAIRAALRLAQTKSKVQQGGTIQIRWQAGMDTLDTKKLETTIRTALEMKMHISNPELQDEIQRIRKSMEMPVRQASKELRTGNSALVARPPAPPMDTSISVR